MANNMENYTQDQYVTLNYNKDLIDKFDFYYNNMRYYMNIKNSKYVKSTTKSYAKYMSILNRSSEYYRNKITNMKYPIILRKDTSNNYYIDYKTNGKILPNKVVSDKWKDYEKFPPHCIVTVYSLDDNIYNKISAVILKYKNFEVQQSDKSVDITFDEFPNVEITQKLMSEDVLNEIRNTVRQHIQNDKNMTTTQNIITDFLNSDSIKNDAENVIQKLKSIRNLDDVNNIISYTLNNQDKIRQQGREIIDKGGQIIEIGRQSNIDIEQLVIQIIENLEIDRVISTIIESNVTICIENNFERYVYLYNSGDTQADIQLDNLLSHINNNENLDFIDDQFSKTLRYTRVPSNPIRVLLDISSFSGIRL